MVSQYRRLFCVLHQRYINTALGKPDSHVLARTDLHWPALDDAPHHLAEMIAYTRFINLDNLSHRLARPVIVRS